MSIDFIFNRIRNDILDAKNKGAESVPFTKLEEYLSSIENDMRMQMDVLDKTYEANMNWSLKFYEMRNASRVERWKQSNEQARAMFHSIIAAGQGALKTSLIVNGGGAIALLGFISRFQTAESQTMPLVYMQALTGMCMGVLSAAFASGFTYYAQKNFTLFPKQQAIGERTSTFAAGSVLLSYLLFGGSVLVLTSNLGLFDVVLDIGRLCKSIWNNIR